MLRFNIAHTKQRITICHVEGEQGVTDRKRLLHKLPVRPTRFYKAGVEKPTAGLGKNVLFDVMKG